MATIELCAAPTNRTWHRQTGGNAQQSQHDADHSRDDADSFEDEFGQKKGPCPASNRRTPVDAILRDIRYSLRRLKKSPAFTAVVVLTLGLGIGANTAIFTVVNSVLLRPLPYRAPEQLVSILHYYPSLNNLEAPVAGAAFRDYRDKTKSFESVAVETGFGANLTGIGDPERVPGGRVSGDWFHVLGVQPMLGRGLIRDDDQTGREHVAVLSYGLWTRLFASSPSAVGKTLELNGETYHVVGVMPKGFRSFAANTVDIFVPLALTPEQYDSYGNEYLNLTARLKANTSVEQARAEMATFAENLKRERPNQWPPRWSLKVRTLDDLATSRIRPALLVLIGAVGFVLLIACANVANLLLARAAVRIKEIAIRAALGADRASLIRQLLTESVMLALGGGLLGLLLAQWSVKSLVALNPSLPRAQEIGVDANVMVFTLAVSLVTGLLFGLAPSLQSSRTNLNETLKDGSRSGSADFAGRTMRRVLVVAEVALSLTLLIGAGLLIESVARLQGVSPGFDSHNVLTFKIALPPVKYPTDTAQILFTDQLLPRLNALPGVQAAGLTSVIPFGGRWSTASVGIEGLAIAQGQQRPWGDFRIASPRFFEALRIPLKRGRLLTDQDRFGAPDVVVIDDEFAKKYFPNTSPIGKRITFGARAGTPDSTWITIVGVVGHAAHEGLDAEPRIQYYFPVAQRGSRGMTVAIRTQGDPLTLVPTVRRAIHEIDAALPMSSINTMDKLVEQSVGQRKLSMILLGVFSAIALLLASLGIYGVMSYSVTQRTRELGIRMALGAARSQVLALVVGQGMALALVGVAIGLVAAFAVTRFLSSQLYGVGATDVPTFVGVSGLLIGIALIACLLPAMRATRVDPVTALREE
jgi:predicted permease